MRTGIHRVVVLHLCLSACVAGLHADTPLTVTQLTTGPQHHFFGYIGHVRTIPWNASGRYIVALQTSFQDHMPRPDEAAEVILIDTHDGNSIRIVDRTRGWNFQQGTMLYWNPEAPETQFFFNDRDPETNRIFTVLYDVAAGKRIREFHSAAAPVGNSGVAQQGGSFCGINYGRLARLRPVTGYPGAFDWTVDEIAPDDDGVFQIDVATGEQRLLVSFAQLQEAIRRELRDNPKSGAFKDSPQLTLENLDRKALFINHTLWNRDDSRIYFYCRGDFDTKERLNVPFTINSDGTGLMVQDFIGGHLEWDERGRVMTPAGDLYDPVERKVVDHLHGLPDGDGDIALSPDARLFARGSKKKEGNFYLVFDCETGTTRETRPISRGDWSGELRVDGAPCWNRNGTQILFAAIADDAEHTRQLFLVNVGRE